MMAKLLMHTNSEQRCLWLPRRRRFYLPPRPALAIARELPATQPTPTRATRTGVAPAQVRLWPAPFSPRPVEELLAEFEPVSLPSTSPAPAPRGRTAEPALAEPLRPREIEILRLIASGLSNQEIADQLHLSLGTVKWHINHLYGKLQVRRRTEAVARARSLGLLDAA
jgi:DNA-binding NarL/FixJ family response regulator